MAALLLLHLLMHPLIHAHTLVGSAPAGTVWQQPGDPEGDRTRLAGPVHCMACRTGAASVATPTASDLDPSPSLSEFFPDSVAFRPIELFQTSLPARAPPLA
ncbi:MAG TPA: hypothetical protein VLB32_03595 [Candidatus Acidoferrales bacterium]|nr:hypothetical protein [Candidatus Acidoferrales bacterium]